MIVGTVTSDGVPIVKIQVAGKTWTAIIDTGFNGDLELPQALKNCVNAHYEGRVGSLLAGGQRVIEDTFIVEFPFDDRTVRAAATFVDGTEILLGTRLLRAYRLEISFPKRTVVLKGDS